MTQPEQSDSGKTLFFSIRLRPDLDARLARIAAEAGISKSKTAALLLEELLPSVEGVRTRLQIVRKGDSRS